MAARCEFDFEFSPREEFFQDSHRGSESFSRPRTMETESEKPYGSSIPPSPALPQGLTSLPTLPQPQNATGPPQGPPGGWLCQRMSKTREILFIIMLTFLQIIPQSTLTTVFPISQNIAQSFNISDVSILPWLVAAYALSFGTFILISGRIGDIFNPKLMVVIGFTSMSIWSVVAAVSHYTTYEIFFVARGFQGLSAAFMVPNGLSLLGRTYPPNSKKKILAFTLFGLFAPVGAYIGMLTGALFAQYLSWWWTFYTYAGFNLALAVAAQIILLTPAKAPPQMKPFKAKLGDFDWLGALTGVGGLMCIQVSLVSAPTLGWKTQFIFMLLIIGFLLVTFFVITEIKIAQHPLVPFNKLKIDVAFTLVAVGCGWATFGVWTWYLWKFMLNFWNWTPLNAAIHAVPIVPVALIASIITAYLMKTTKPAWTLFFALLAFMLGPLLLAINPNINAYWGCVFASLVVMPFGMDLSFPASTLIVSNFFPPQQQGVAGSLISTVVYYSISLGLGLASTVEVKTNSNGTNLFQGIRSGWFMGVGLGGLGVIVCIIFIVKTYLVGGTTSTHPPPLQPPNLPNDSRDTTFSNTSTLRTSPEKHPSVSSSTTHTPPRQLHPQPDRDEISLLHSLKTHPSTINDQIRQNHLPEMEPAYKNRGSLEFFDFDDANTASGVNLANFPRPGTRGSGPAR